MTGIYGNAECTFPRCSSPTTTCNRCGQPTCQLHRLVVVSGSFVEDKHAGASHG